MKRPRLSFPLPLTADDVCRHALAAYYASSQDCTPDPRDPDPATWANPSDFVRFLLHTFAVRVQADAHAAGCPGFEEAPALLARRDRPLYWPELRAVPGAGRSPANKGQGCPAPAAGGLPPAVAVGPAPTGVNAANIINHANALFCAHAMQGLPELSHRDNLDIDGEKTA